MVFCVAEIATILASANPTLPLSQPILSMLVWNGAKPDNLRMSNVTAIGFILMVLGASIRIMTFRYLGRFFRFEVSIQEDHELIVSGPYAVVRHPSYSGLLMLLIGWFPWQMSKGSWVIESGLWDMTLGRSLVMINIALIFMGAFQVVLVRTPKEDAALRKHFGAKWDKWAKDVPYAVIPGIY
jgi:protein-S-isoprenylcysteine O-methyltransferase Ste14